MIFFDGLLVIELDIPHLSGVVEDREIFKSLKNLENLKSHLGNYLENYPGVIGDEIGTTGSCLHLTAVFGTPPL